jgi:hypothetical protein
VAVRVLRSTNLNMQCVLLFALQLFVPEEHSALRVINHILFLEVYVRKRHIHASLSIILLRFTPSVS